MYGDGKSACAGHGVWGPNDSGVGLRAVAVTGLLISGAGDESRTLSAKDSARSLVVLEVGAGVGFGAANGFSLPAAPEFEEKGFELDDTALVSDVAPNKLAPRSSFDFGTAAVPTSFSG